MFRLLSFWWGFLLSPKLVGTPGIFKTFIPEDDICCRMPTWPPWYFIRLEAGLRYLQVLDFHTYWSPLPGICLLGPESFEDGLKFATGGVFLLPLENAAIVALSAFFSPKSRLSQVQRWRKRDNWVPRAERSVDFSLGGGHAALVLQHRKSTVWASNIFQVVHKSRFSRILYIEHY